MLMAADRKKEIYGGEADTTNQRMELKAVIEALRALKVNDWDVVVYSDSAYVVNAFRQHWIENWQKNGWKNSRKEAVANQDLWQELLLLMGKNRVRIEKVKGHAGDEWNERCDQLARQGVKELKEG